MGMTDREERLLLTVLETECENADLIKQKWADTPDEGYEDGPAALAYERAFSDGVALGSRTRSMGERAGMTTRRSCRWWAPWRHRWTPTRRSGAGWGIVRCQACGRTEIVA